jgi:hypothetical protein
MEDLFTTLSGRPGDEERELERDSDVLVLSERSLLLTLDVGDVFWRSPPSMR